ncbi:MAG: hypothetical protein ABI542_08805 [Gemmatimonadota bacterium]
MTRPLSVFALLLAACGGAAVSPPARMVAVDSVLLKEDPDHPIGESIGIVVRATDGRVFLADMAGRTIQRFEADGRFGGTIGTAGSGPGELGAPGGIGLLDGDSVLAVIDPNRAVLIEFNSADGTLRRELPFPGGAIPASGWLSDMRTTLVPVLGALHPFLRWDRLNDSVTPFGEAPAEWGGSLGLAMSHGVASLVSDSSGYLAMIPLVPGLLRLDAVGSRVTLIPIPAVRRKGEPDGAAAKALAEAKQSGRRTTAPIASMALGLHRRSDGALMLVHLDPDLESGSGGTQPTALRYYITLVRPDLRAACVDAPIPLETDVFARPLFAGDTVFFLARTVGADGQAPLWLRGFVLDDASCAWIPLEPGR